MREVFGDVWEVAEREQFDCVCIPTNGSVNRHGYAVMGRGVAEQAARRYPWLKQALGERLTRDDPRGVYAFEVPYKSLFDDRLYPRALIAFPVKHRWQEEASLALISASAETLRVTAKALPSQRFLLPRPGCGNGGLEWERVKPICEALPDNVWVIDRTE